MEQSGFFLPLAKGLIKHKVKSSFLNLNIGRIKLADLSKHDCLVMEIMLSELYRRGKKPKLKKKIV